MSELITRTARLVPYAKRPKQVPSFVTAYSYEPLAEEPGAGLGSLFVVIEVLVSGRSSEEVADLVIGAMADHYYNQTDAQTDPIQRFEAAIKATNHQLVEYVNQGNAAWIGKLSAVVAIQNGSQLHLTQTGSAEAFLYRGKAAARISNQDAARPAAPSKTFGSIASGDLESGDRLLLATPALIHQLPLTKLKTVVSDTSPNNAIAEITQLLRGGASERIAALIIEITTPELAALQVRSEEPSEIQLGSPDNVLEAAKMATAPIAQATVTSTKRAGAAAKTTWQKNRPYLEQALQKSITFMRDQLSHQQSRQRWIIGGVLAVVILGLVWQWQTGATRTSRLNTRYQTDYHQYQLAAAAADAGDKTTARQMLAKLQNELTSLFQEPGRAALDAKLKHSPNGTPKSVADLASLTSGKLDQLEGLQRVDVTTAASFSSIRNSKPTRFELAAGKAYIFDTGPNPALYISNLGASSIQKSKADLSRVGPITATTLSGASDGIYLLSSKPSVWFYSFATDKITEQTTDVGQWPSGAAIASYGGNLYILGDGVIYKHVKTYSGFSPKTVFLPATTAGLAGATAMTVDGSTYALSSSGLRQYIAGALKATADVPAALSAATALRSTNDGNTLIAASDNTKRVGFWNTAKTPVFAKQYELNGVSTLYDAAYDAKTQTAYALVNGRLIRFTP